MDITSFFDKMKVVILDDLDSSDYSFISYFMGDFSVCLFYKKEHLVCPKCGHKFNPSVLKMIVAPNYISGKYIECPNCHIKEYCDVHKD